MNPTVLSPYQIEGAQVSFSLFSFFDKGTGKAPQKLAARHSSRTLADIHCFRPPILVCFFSRDGERRGKNEILIGSPEMKGPKAQEEERKRSLIQVDAFGGCYTFRR